MPGRRVATMILAVACATLAVGLAATVTGCPSGCACKWKGGKQTVECVNMSLLTIPTGADTGTQVLDMSGNALEALSRGRFMAAGLSNLQKIFMARCRIRYVDDAAFRGLTNLVELDLSDNAIADVPTKSFADYPQLMKLVLSGNAVTAVRTAAFKRLKYLTVLDLSRCLLSTVEPGAFDGLQSLEWLRLDHNRIARIEGAAVLPLSLHGIEMHHNPWACDCRLRDVHRWLNNNSAPHTVEPTCHGPDRLRGSTVRKLAAEELACAPEAAAASPAYVETDAGKNVTLQCLVTPVGEARVTWRFEGRPVANNGTVADGPQLSIEDVGPADNGTYECVAENRAGRAACNFTVRVVQEPSEMAAGGSYPPAAPAPALLVVALAAGSVCLVAFAVACAVTCRLTLAKRRRRRAKPADGAAPDGDDESANDGLRTAKTPSDIRQSDSVNLTTVSSSTMDGKLSSAEDVCSVVYGECDPTSAVVAAAAYETHDVLRAGSASGYDPYRAHDIATNACTLEANPDLISDASTVVRDAGGDYRDGEVYKIALPPGGREFWSGGVPVAVCPSNAGGDGCQPLSYKLQLSPRKLLADGEPYPPDYGLPKLQPPTCSQEAMGYPPDYGLPKLLLYPAQPQSYRTLPHRRNAAKPQGRSCQEAEFVLLQQNHHQNAHHHHHHHHHQQMVHRYEPQNVRYNLQGYPYPATVDAAYYTSAAAFYEPPSLSNASAQTLDEETMTAMIMLQPSTTATSAALPPTSAGRLQQRLQPAATTASSATPEQQQQQQHKAVTSVQKQSANTESPDEGYVGEGPDS